VDVLLLAAFPVGAAGLVSLVGLRRTPAPREPSLGTLLAAGGLTFLMTALLFPVATRWGTFLHASGPLLVGLLVMAVLGADAFLARISRVRRWKQTNVVLGPTALIAVAVLLGVLQLGLLSGQGRDRQQRVESIASSVRAVANELGVELPTAIITDHPMWLADALDRDALALPDEGVASVLELSRRFAAPWVVVIDERGRYPAALLDESARRCLVEDPRELPAPGGNAWLFRLVDDCAAA
jgi:hypothetical protein